MDNWGKGKLLEEKLLFWYGFVATMPIIQILGMTVFTWYTLGMVVFLLASKMNCLKIQNKVIVFIAITISTMVSSIMCLMGNLPNMWKASQLKDCIWQICYLIIFIAYCNKGQFKKCIFYIKGIYYSALFQMGWGILQLATYAVTQISINKLLFYDILHVQEAAYIQTRGNSIALTGLCWNAGNIAPLLVIAYTFSKSTWIKIFVVLFSLLSGSRTALLGVAVCIMIDIFFFLIQYKKRVSPKIIMGIIFSLILCGVVLLFNREWASIILNKVSETLSSFSVGYLKTQSSSRIHSRYWKTIFQVMEWNPLINNLFGYGSNCSGYPFAILYNQYADHAWTVECDFIGYLWNYGFIGFILWYAWYLFEIIRGLKIDKKYFILFGGFLVEGIAYNITFNWCYVFLLMLFIQIMYKRDAFKPTY